MTHNDENMVSALAISEEVIYITPVNDVLTLKTDGKQHSEVSTATTIKLPSIDYVLDITLYLNCINNIEVTFHTSADNQTVELDKGYHKLEMSYFGDWIIRC